MARPPFPWYYAAKDAWYVWIGGRRVRLGVRGRQGLPQALQALRRVQAGLPPSEPPGSIPGPPLPRQTARPRPTAEQVEDYLEDAAGRVGAETLRGYRKYLAPWAATAPPLTREAVLAYCRRPGWSSSYACGFVGCVSAFLAWLARRGELAANPLAGVRKPRKESRGRKALLAPGTLRTLVEGARGAFRDYLHVLHLTGARPGEVAALTAADVDAAGGVAVLDRHKTAGRTGRPRVIVLTPEALAVLARRAAERPTGPLFPDRRGGVMTANVVACRVSRLCKRLGVRATAYGLRHTYATDALAAGVPDATVAALLGHQGTAMLHKHYSHLVERVQVLRDAGGRVRPGGGPGSESLP